MIELDPDKRISCEEALKHDYLRPFHDEDDEPTGDLFDDKYESENNSTIEWKCITSSLISNKKINLYFCFLDRIFDEIKAFVPPPIESINI